MRKITFTLFFAAASALVANAQVTNGDLETWTSAQWSTVPTGSGNSYLEPGTGTNRNLHFLRGLNQLNDLPGLLNIPKSCFRSDTAHGGSYSARVRSQQFTTYFIPGFLGTGDIDIQNQTLYLGRPYVSRPDSFSVWYLYAPVADDSAKFEVIFTKYDALNQQTNVIGHGSQVVLNATTGTNWQNVKFAIDWTSTDAPDTVQIIAAASGGYNLSDFLQSSGEVGSQLWVDDINLWSGHIGIENEYINLNVNIYPNPATDFVTISTGNLPSDMNITLFDVNGKQISSKNMNSNNYQLDVTGLATGVYAISITDSKNNLVHRSKFIKK